jgi:hypothetical protein
VHEAAGVNVPAPLLENVTVPVGVVAGAGPVSVTVAVHVVEVFTATVLGEHETEVLVGRGLTVIDVAPELLKWLLSPPYEAVII